MENEKRIICSVTHEYYRLAFDHVASLDYPYPHDRFHGDGIVICGGGLRYLPSAWISIRALRDLGCKLPIELWCLDEREMLDSMSTMLAEQNVTCINAEQIRRKYPFRGRLGGWELKSYSIVHSAFERVLLIDADNMMLSNPEELFAGSEFNEVGTVFWPDTFPIQSDADIWHICGVPYREEPAVESGQLLINKRRSWKALMLALHMNENSNFYYNFIYGDKDTFHLAWRRANTPYAIPEFPLQWLKWTMCQHGFDGIRLFQHRNMDKWRLHPRNETDPGFINEQACFSYLDELDDRWKGRGFGIPRWSISNRSQAEIEAADTLTALPHLYIREGYDSRVLTFSRDGRIIEGTQVHERYWNIFEEDSKIYLQISGDAEITLVAEKDGPYNWKGAWLIAERMPSRIVPTGPITRHIGNA